MVTTVEGARRLGFVIENLKETRAKEQSEEEWLKAAIDKHQRFMRKHELTY
jgi:hypothetical protein